MGRAFFLLVLATIAPLVTSDCVAATGSSAIYEALPLLTGDICQKGSEPPRLLFKFRRTATSVGSITRVLREYNTPEGSAAARERVVYQNGQLLSCELEESQTGATGSAALRPDPKNTDQQKWFFTYTARPGTRAVTNSEVPAKDVLVNDMIPGFMLSHWDALMTG